MIQRLTQPCNSKRFLPPRAEEILSGGSHKGLTFYPFRPVFGAHAGLHATGYRTDNALPREALPDAINYYLTSTIQQYYTYDIPVEIRR